MITGGSGRDSGPVEVPDPLASRLFSSAVD